jgi:hypothetical protein
VEFTDREIIVSLFDAIGALAEKLTGERMAIRVDSKSGDFIWLYGGQYVRWLKAGTEETSVCQGQLSRPDLLLESDPKLFGGQHEILDSQQVH